MKKPSEKKQNDTRQMSMFDAPPVRKAKKKKIRKNESKTGNPRKVKAYGADDVYLTKNGIAVRRTKSKIAADGKIVYVDRTVYYPKTKDNVKIATRQHGGKLRSGRK